MKNFFRTWTDWRLWSAAALTCPSLLLAETNDNDLDLQAIKQWINIKRQVTVKEIGGSLSISGEVRAEFQKAVEKLGGVIQRGAGSATGTPINQYDVEVNLMFDYRADRSWASIKLEFDNNAGIFNGTSSNIKLERAYFGARVISGTTYVFDVEVGRRKLGTIFDSKLEFGALFDGVLFKYDQGVEGFGDVFTHAGVFLIDEKASQYGYVGELGLLNIAGTGAYTKVSLIDWDTKEFSNVVTQERFDFLVSQLTFGYKWIPQKLQKIVNFYSAFLMNWKAKPLAVSNYHRSRVGAYIGFTIGELRRRNDWSIDINYQWLGAQAVPDYDVSGIGTGNAAGSGFYTSLSNGGGTVNTVANAGGNTNYRGISLSWDYLLTDNLLLSQSWVQSVTLDKTIGPFHTYKQFEIEMIYGF